MSLIKDIAAKIPDDVRSLVLMTPDDPIHNAKAVKTSDSMMKLVHIWYQFIEPDKEYTGCPVCLDNILTNFRQMKPALIELENEYQKLKNV